ncbi:MAG: hypothetical protein QXW91_05615 [Candidatus Nitrosotenuis sp.]
MSQTEREFTSQVDKIILEASPELLAKLADIDRKTQLTMLTFYEVYLQLSDEDRKQIMVSSDMTKSK